MAQIMIKCPVSNHAIATAVEVKSDADPNGLLDIAYHVNCPSCGFNYVWFKNDAWIAERPELHQYSRHEEQSRSKAG